MPKQRQGLREYMAPGDRLAEKEPSQLKSTNTTPTLQQRTVSRSLSGYCRHVWVLINVAMNDGTKFFCKECKDPIRLDEQERLLAQMKRDEEKERNSEQEHS